MSIQAKPDALRVGLTGGIASGKTTVADLFAELGVPVIDTDVIARQVVEPGEPGLARVQEAFGDGVIDASGRLDRKGLRRRVFSSQADRKRLEEILHPFIRARMLEQSAAAGGPYQIIVVPLLVESGLEGLFDRILVVDVPRETQISRLLERDRESQDQAKSILSAQASREERLSAADDIIQNTGGLDKLRGQVLKLHTRYLKLAAERSPRSLP